MSNIRSIGLSMVAAVSMVGVTGAIAKSQSANIVLVAGSTNNGNRLVFVPNSVRIDSESKNRVFNYAVMKPSGESSINADAYTPWCRFGKVQLDPRAIDNQVFGLTFVYHKVNPARQPGWFANGQYIVANSPASRNLLKSVCAIDTSNNIN
ncbi:hypothetical protein CK510_16780 [Brunnivagina elsteri CCALA 953]|uniref:Uncharacterized protein n=2 Tax=Brunnivagina TaxID=3344733 RepID=A0A2A2TGP2_9CYAN|nr:hypothetical protein CK510_16780 [Calothrix elsteri CCALA 953]